MDALAEQRIRQARERLEQMGVINTDGRLVSHELVFEKSPLIGGVVVDFLDANQPTSVKAVTAERPGSNRRATADSASYPAGP